MESNENPIIEDSENDTQYILENTDVGIRIRKFWDPRRRDEQETLHGSRVKTLMRNSDVFDNDKIDNSNIRFKRWVYFNEDRAEIESLELSTISNDDRVILRALSYTRQWPFLFTQWIEARTKESNEEVYDSRNQDDAAYQLPLERLDYKEPVRFVHSQDTYMTQHQTKEDMTRNS